MGLSVFAEFAVMVAFFSSVIFLVGYSILAEWWLNPIGRSLALMDASLVLALFPTAVLHYLFGQNLQHRGFAIYYSCSLLLVGASTLWRLAVMARVQRAGAAPRHASPAEPDPPADLFPQTTGDQL